MEGNWVCLHRKILESEIHDRPNLAWLFVTCILMANWKPTFYKGFELQRGQFATSHTKLGKRTGLSRFQVLRGLKVLADAGMLTEQVVHNRFTVITVCNYDTYQDTAQVTRTPSAQVLHTARTPSAHPSEEQREEAKPKEQGKPKAANGRFDPRAVEVPPELDTDAFHDAWTLWCDHRRDIRKPLKPTMVKAQFAEMVEMGDERAVAMINWTVSKGWQGLREPDTNGRSSKPRESTRI